MRISLRKVVIVLAILTIAMTGAAVYAYVSEQMEQEQIIVTEHPSKAGFYIKVSEVGYVPSQYYDLDEDPYLDEAPYIRASIENPDKWVWVGPKALTGYAKVDGKYYGIGSREVFSGPAIESDFILPLGFLGLGVCWVGVAYTYRRNRKRIEGK